MTAPRRAPVMVPVLVSFTGTVEVMVAARDYYAPGMALITELPEIRTALAYVTPEGFTVDEITDWEALPQ